MFILSIWLTLSYHSFDKRENIVCMWNANVIFVNEKIYIYTNPSNVSSISCILIEMLPDGEQSSQSKSPQRQEGIFL